jgi:hypothetical protein
VAVPSEAKDGPSPGVGALWASFAASLLTAAIAAPVLVSPATRLFGLETVGRHHDPFTFIEQLQSGEFSAPFFQPVTDGPGWLMARVLEPVVAFNVLVLASFPLSAAAAYLLARRTIGSHAGALVAALLYAFSPFHMAHAAYHPHVAQTQWLPVYVLALWRALEDATASRLALLAGASLLLGLSNFYSGLIGGVLTLGVLAAAGVAGRRDPRRLRSLGRTGLALACPVAIVGGAIAALAPEALAQRFAFPASDAALFSARAWSYLLPPVYHPLFGRWSRGLWERAGLGESIVEQQVGLGWSVLALAVVAIAGGLRGRERALPHLSWVLGPAALAFVCSLPGGGLLLHAPAPMFRAYARFGGVVQLAVALLAGAGVALLQRGASPGRRAVVAMLLAGAVVEYAPPAPSFWRDVLPTSAHRWLAKQPGPVRALDCVPPSLAEQSVPILFGRPLSFAQPPLDCAEPDPARKLAWRGFTHLLVRRDTPAGRWLDGKGPEPGLRVAAAFEDAVVLAVAPNGTGPFVVDLAGFHAREYDRGRTWRWIGREGSWTIGSLGREATPASLEIELSAFAVRRRVEILLDQVRVEELEVPTDPRHFTIGPLSIPAGRSVLVFRPREAPVVANSVIGNGDPREVSIAVGAWRWRRAGERSGFATIAGR